MSEKNAAQKIEYVAPIEDQMPRELVVAESLRQRGELDEALRVCVNFMNDHFEHLPAITLAAHIMIDAGRFGMAQPLLKLASKLDPNSSIVWNNLGLCYQEGTDVSEGEACFIKALHRNPTDAFALNNLAQLYVNTAQPDKAINCADRAIELDPELPDAHYNRGLAKLQKGEWAEGWIGYDYKLGPNDKRKERVYGRIPRWTGVNGLTLVAYGEQGIGDEISFASCIPDAAKENKVIVECDSRLKGLFRRSFPQCDVYGTRNDNGINWPAKYDIDAAVAFGSLPRFYRNKDSDFTGKPYLVADPERRLQWRALLDSLGPKLKVGIAWSGGLKNTGKHRRSVLIGDLMPILRQDATFISLQYKDSPEIVTLERDHGIKIHHWPHAVQTKDYDDTAALVAELDLVITVTQSAVHLAGALGVPCWVLTPKEPMWRYGLEGEKMPWYESVKLYRQTKEWMHVIATVATDLRTITLPQAWNKEPH